ncbi:hypothetical protein ABMA28_017065 [Loxostege sticticalis]|uniref:Endonuclease/exonuclease/phosphatase domain-containing protein n=1 Tax=Loxostege sticticalis TaxID=481309 RepID=A0ABD0TAP8_LOXSC
MDSRLTTQELDCIQIARSVKCNVQDWSNHCNEFSSHNLFVLTLNIRSIYKNFDDLQITLAQLDIEVDILILTESRINLNKQLPLLKNYTPYLTSTLQNQNDGVVVYIRDTHRAVVTDLNLTHATGLQIVTADCAFLGIYRSPSHLNADSFINSLNQHLENISNYKNIFVIADTIIKQSESSGHGSVVPKSLNSHLSTFVLLDTDPGEVDSILMSLDSGSAPGWDGNIMWLPPQKRAQPLLQGNISPNRPTTNFYLMVCPQGVKSSRISKLRSRMSMEAFGTKYFYSNVTFAYSFFLFIIIYLQKNQEAITELLNRM